MGTTGTLPRLCAALAAVLDATTAGATVPDRGLLQLHRTDFGQADGLPSERVTAIAPSRTGHLWIGTSAGLARFDGKRFESYDSRRQAAMEGDDVAGLVEDEAGDLWIALYTGDVVRRRGSTGQMDRIVQAPGGAADGIWSAGGAIWLGTTRGLVVVRGDRVELMGAARGIPEGNVGGVAADAEGQIGRAHV